MARDLLDDLLVELEKSSSEDEHEDIPLILLGNNQTDEPQDNDEEEMQPVSENINILKTLSPSSAKKRMIKDSHCYFCEAECDRETLHDHLSESERCRTLYLRKLHVNSIDAVMVVSFQCLFCDETNFTRLYHHIETFPACQAKYYAKFGVSSSLEVSEAIKKLKRSAYPSRRSLYRNEKFLENKRRKYDEDRNKSMESFLNTHLMSTTFANVKLCIQCYSNVQDASEVNHQIENKEDLRLNKLWICTFCDREVNFEELTAPGVKMRSIVSEDGGEITFVPDFGQIDDEIEAENDTQSAADRSEQMIKVILPCSVKSLSNLDPNVSARGLSPLNVQRLLYRSGRLIDEEFLGHIYMNQIAKYRSAETNADLFCGKIDNQNINTKVLSSVNPCSKEHRIKGSDEFRRRQVDDIKWRMANLGRYCLKLKVEFPLINLQTVMTSLVQQGKIVTVSYSGDRANELHQSYTIHAGHDSSSACIEECITVTEDTYQGLDVTTPDISTYVSSVDSKVNSFLKNIIKSPASPFESQIYFLQVSFNSKGEASLEGVLWPQKFRNINLSLIDDSFKFDVELEELVNLLKSCISTSSKKQSLKEQFSLCDQEAKDIEKLVKTNQLHLCEDESECEKCSDPPLPSLEWIITKCPDETENIYSCKRLLGALKSNLMSMPREDLLTMSTMDWLEQLWDEMESEVEENVWSIEYDSELYQLKLNASLNKLIVKYSDCPLLAAYHYALSCVEKDEENKVIIKRSHLQDMFTEPFYPFFLKASKSPISVKLITSHREWKASSYVIPDYANALKNGLANHTSVSLSEALSLTDTNKTRIKSSTALEFVFTGPETKSYFKKVREHNENCFVLAGEDGGVFYEYQETIVSRYFRRMNAKELLLCELAAFYEYLGRENSEPKFQVYRDRMDKIELSDVESIRGNEKLPELVLIENGDVLQKRKQPKILKYPEYSNDSFEFRHSQVLLFHKIERKEDLCEKQKVEDMFILCDDNGVNVVEKNRKIFYNIVRKLKYDN